MKDIPVNKVATSNHALNRTHPTSASRPSASLHSVLSLHGGGGGGGGGVRGDANNIVTRRRLAKTHAKDIPFPCA